MAISNKKKAAAVGVSALMLGGIAATTALWSDSDSFGAGTITAGNLDVAAIDDQTAWDVTPGRADASGTAPVTGSAGHVIDDLATWRIVPGDTIEIAQSVDVGLEGDNLVADLSVGSAADPSGDLLANAQGVTLTYSVYDIENNVIGTAQDVALGTPSTIALQAAGVGQSAGVDDEGILVIDAVKAEGTADLKVVVTATFDESTPDQVRTQTQAALSDLTVDLDQRLNTVTP